MELITILNRCHRFRGFVYQQARLSADHKSIEISVRARKGSVALCSRCHEQAPGYDQLAERRFEFIPLWGFFVFLLYTMRRVDCARCAAVVVEEVPWGDGKRTLTKAYMLFLARWARHLSWKETAEAFRTSWELTSQSTCLFKRFALFFREVTIGRSTVKRSSTPWSTSLLSGWSIEYSARSTQSASMKFSMPKGTSI